MRSILGVLKQAWLRPVLSDRRRLPRVARSRGNSTAANACCSVLTSRETAAPYYWKCRVPESLVEAKPARRAASVTAPTRTQLRYSDARLLTIRGGCYERWIA